MGGDDGAACLEFVSVLFLVAKGNQTIPPDAQRHFAARMGATTTEVSTNPVAMVSHPEEVVTMIEAAAAAVSVAGS